MAQPYAYTPKQGGDMGGGSNVTKNDADQNQLRNSKRTGQEQQCSRFYTT
jgi:hypothetical protein